MLTITVQEGLSPDLEVRAMQLVLHLARATPVRLTTLSPPAQGILAPLFSSAERDSFTKLSPEPRDQNESLPDLRAHLESRIAQGPPEDLLLWGGLPLPPPTQGVSRVVLLDGADTPVPPSAHRCVYTFNANGGPHAVALPRAAELVTFGPAHGPRADLILVAFADMAATVAVARSTHTFGPVQVLDPYGRHAPVDLPEGIPWLIIADSSSRAALFREARGVVVDRPHNHFAWEAQACGAPVLTPPPGALDELSLHDALQTPAGDGTAPTDWSAIVSKLLSPTPPAAPAVHRWDLPNGVIEQHTCLPATATTTLDPRTVVLCAGSGAASSEALANYLTNAAHVLVAYPDRCARLVMDMPLMRQGEPYTTSFKVRKDLFEHLAHAPGRMHVEVVHLEEGPDAIATMGTLLTGLAQLMQTQHLRRAPAPPRAVVCIPRPPRHIGPSTARLGASVASDSVKSGLLQAAGVLDVNWFDHDPPPAAEQARVYFSLDELPRGLSQDELGAVNLSHLLRNGLVDLIMHLGPFRARSLAARNRFSRRPFPVVGLLHSVHGAALGTELIAQLLEGGTLPCDTVISPSRCGAASFARLQDAAAEWLSERTGKTWSFNGSLEVLPYGIDTAAYGNLDRTACRAALALPQDAVVLLHMGRIDRREKADLLPLLQALRIVLQKHPHAYLVICGGITAGDTYADNLASCANQLGVGHATRITVNVPWMEKRLYHGAADIALALGDCVQETYGLSLLEAMAAGLPVVASEWDGFREIVRHDATGLLVPTLWTDTWAEDAWLQRLAEGPTGYGHRDLHESVAVEIPALVAALDTLIGQPAARQRMGSAGQALCRSDYEERTQGERLIALFIQRMEEAATVPWKGDPGAPFVDPAMQRFIHYATRNLTDTDTVRTAPHASAQFVDSTLSMAGIADASSRKILHAMLELCQTPQPVAALEKVLSARTHVPIGKLRRHILRALKYSLLHRA